MADLRLFHERCALFTYSLVAVSFIPSLVSGFSQTAMVERQSQMREMVLDNVCMTLAGRAAEEVVCGTISGGASSDLRVASRTLYHAITE